MNEYVTFDTYIESARVTLRLVDLELGETVFAVVYFVSGDNLHEMSREVAEDFAVVFEIALWRQWIAQNVAPATGGDRD
jgi:hypothetical protein